MSLTTGTTDVAQLQQWVVGRVAFYLQMAPADIDPTSSLADLGMNSVYAVSLCGDIEETYGFEVEPTLAWDYPTAVAIAGYLHELNTTGVGEWVEKR